MAPDEILEYCLNKLEGTGLINGWGERGRIMQQKPSARRITPA